MLSHRSPSQAALHVALIMDGNGRWAESRDLPRAAGHQAGVDRANRLHVRIALDYSARDAIVRAARASGGAARLTRKQFGRLVAGEARDPAATRVDLLVRTGGEQRLSDFLLWESAYAELVFSPTLWPDFTSKELQAAVREFRQRQRRFGGLPKRAAS